MSVFDKKLKNEFSGLAALPAGAFGNGGDVYNASLTKPVIENDMAAVRGILDQSFLQKSAIVPHWYHLFAAVENQNRDMVRLLVEWGASWTQQQRDILLPLLGDKVHSVKALLPRSSASDVFLNDDDLAKLKSFMEKRIALERQEGGDDARKSQYYHVLAAVEQSCQAGKYELAFFLMTCAPRDEMDHSLHISRLRLAHNISPGAPVAVAKRLVSEGYVAELNANCFHSPFNNAGRDYPQFDDAGLLNHANLPDLRQKWIGGWASHIGGTDKWFNEITDGMKGLHDRFYTQDANVSADEADAFIRLHETWFGDARHNMQKYTHIMLIDHTLQHAGYFEAAGFNASHLYRLAQQSSGEVSECFTRLVRQKNKEAMLFKQAAHI